MLSGRLTPTKFRQIIVQAENRCAKATATELPKAGQEAPACYEVLYAALAITDCTAGCFWGCKGGDHRVEYLIGSATNLTYAALCLMSRGYYDQALSITRTVGEFANLPVLFAFEKSQIDKWKGADNRTRKRAFSPMR